MTFIVEFLKVIRVHHFKKNLTSYHFQPHPTILHQVGVYSVVTLGNTTRLFFVPSSPCYALGLAFVQEVINTLRKERNAGREQMLDRIFTEQCLSPTQGFPSTPMLETRSTKQPDLHLLPPSSPLPSNILYVLLVLTALLSLLLILVTLAVCRLSCHRESNAKPPQLLVMQVAPSSSHSGRLTSFPHHQVQQFPQLLTIADLPRQEVRRDTGISSAKLDSYGYVA